MPPRCLSYLRFDCSLLPRSLSSRARALELVRPLWPRALTLQENLYWYNQSSKCFIHSFHPLWMTEPRGLGSTFDPIVPLSPVGGQNKEFTCPELEELPSQEYS